MKCQGLFSGKNQKIIISLSSAEFALGVVKVNTTTAKKPDKCKVSNSYT